uniref:F-box domain-containing protein n=1 Tax=Micromonas pusilla TaxID=38833 RepID=A0A7S0KTI9_MICPS|mmetsp:Transcript_4086/g.15156  ORF Transcript_4086/g.15156 Transcript_4086/m.15156 type:complete len:268 (+) Transcript_4086:74-877(+)
MTAVKEGLTEERGEAGAAAPIDELPPEVLYHILSFLPRSAGTANALVGVCKGWREAILTDDAYLGSLNFSLDASQPFKGMETVRGAVAHRRTWAYADRHARAIDGAASTTTTTTRGFESGGGGGATVPALLRRAADVGSNATALETLAALFEARGDVAGAYRSWRKAASLGSCLAQFKLGEIFYRGSGNQGVDGEEALFWLSKAMKSSALAPECRATAAGIMGFLHLDGEGTAACNTTAIKWFKVAAENGCAEALKTLGWLYSTGQY